MQNKRCHNFIRYMVTAVILLIIGAALGYYQITPTRLPKAYKDKLISIDDIKDADADFNMTMSHVYRMAQEPHPSVGKAIQHVREYLVDQFNKIGCDYMVQPVSVNRKVNLDIVNYIAKVDAPNTDSSILFVCHYDSTAFGPGAADDLISVGSMLEALRSVKNQKEIKNDIYFIFMDGEEQNLLGSKAYVAAFPDMKNRTKLVINMEARGNSGTLFMFETSPDNKALVKTLSKTLDHITMFSFTASIYRIMPNDTDLTTFLDAGYPGLNFAMVGSPQNYHQMSDNYANMDRDSAFMYFQTAVGLAKYFAKADTSTLKSSEDAVYFPFLKGNTLVLSNRIMFVFSCFIGVFSLLWIAYLLIRRECKLSNLIATTSIMLVSLLFMAILGFFGTYLSNIVSTKDVWINNAGTLNSIFYVLCVVAAIIMLLSIYLAAKRANGCQTLLISGMLLFNLLNWVCISVLNSLAYLFTIPLCILFLYSTVIFVTKGYTKMNYICPVVTTVLGLIILLLYTPIIYLIYIALLSDILFVVTLLTGLSVLPIAILCCTSLPGKNEGENFYR